MDDKQELVMMAVRGGDVANVPDHMEDALDNIVAISDTHIVFMGSESIFTVPYSLDFEDLLVVFDPFIIETPRI